MFERDWRVGSGEAAGRHLDDRVRRDGHGLPFLPGSTVRGIVADSIQRLAQALALPRCDGTVRREGESGLRELCGVTRPGEEVCPLCVLTGSPHLPAKVHWGAARLVLKDGEGRPIWKPKLREALAGEAQSAPELLTRPHARTAIDEKSGRAEDEHLFSLEEARADLELAGAVEIEPDVSRENVSLLVAALRFVRAVGGSRRRGLGACRIRIDEARLAPHFGSWQEAVQALDAEPSEGAEGDADSTAPREDQGDLPAAGWPDLRSSGPVHLQLDARVVGEIAVGGRPEAGNLVSGLPFIPGSSVRGALAGQWSGEVGGEDFLRCFVSGQVRFGPLNPMSRQRTSRPVPLSVHTCKRSPGSEQNLRHGLVDLLLRPKLERCEKEDCGSRLVPWPEAFDAEVPLALSPHNRIDFESQTVRAGGLFAYEGLAEGTGLRGFVAAEDGAEMETLVRGLGLEPGKVLTLRVGRRKGALGHLDCEVTLYRGEESGIGLFPDFFPEGRPVPESWPESDCLRVDLLTPAIVVDEHLRYRKALTPPDLDLPEGIGFERSFGGWEILSGWHAARGLPKSDQVAVSRGSSYLVRRPGEGADQTLEALRTAARDGIGLRRTEGFGAVSVTAVERRDLEEGRS
jgi:CRISPR-associated protein Csx10